VVGEQHRELAVDDHVGRVAQLDEAAVVVEHRVLVAPRRGGVDLDVVGVDLDPRRARGEPGVR
jgi:hypothetical protein